MTASPARRPRLSRGPRPRGGHRRPVHHRDRVDRACLETGRKKAALPELLQRGPTILGVHHPLDRRSVALNRLVPEGAHSNWSPEDTRRISSGVVRPAAALFKASWCIVVIVRCAIVFNSA